MTGAEKVDVVQAFLCMIGVLMGVVIGTWLPIALAEWWVRRRR